MFNARTDERADTTLEYFDALKEAEIAWNKFQNSWDEVNSIYADASDNHSFYWKSPAAVMVDFKYKRNNNTRLAEEVGDTSRGMV